jgi:hypothetical protein
MNTVQTISQTNIVPIASTDVFLAYADAVAPSYIVGRLLRFSKGDYLVGENGEKIAIGVRLLAAVDELMVGWMKWHGGKPAEHVMVRLLDGKALPKRQELGDGDEAQWEVGNDGKPRDPWNFVNYLPMLEAKANELFTFTSSSTGGIKSIGNLARRYANHAKRHPDVFPLITLDVGEYPHRNKEFGRVKFPDFQPAGYAPKKHFYEVLEATGVLTASPVPIDSENNENDGNKDVRTAPTIEEPPPCVSQDEFADEIPF